MGSFAPHRCVRNVNKKHFGRSVKTLQDIMIGIDIIIYTEGGKNLENRTKKLYCKNLEIQP